MCRGVSLFHRQHRLQCGRAGSIYQLRTTPALWTSRTFPSSPPPAVEMGCRVHSFPQPAVWRCRVYLTCSISSVDVQDVSFFAASSGRAGCISLFTASSIDVQVRMYPSLPSFNVFKCQNVGLSGMRSVRYRNDLKYRCREQSGTGTKGPQSNTGLRCRMPGCRFRGGIDLDTCAQLCSVKGLWGRCLSVADVPTLARVLLLLGSYCCWSPCCCLLTFFSISATSCMLHCPCPLSAARLSAWHPCRPCRVSDFGSCVSNRLQIRDGVPYWHGW
jgi:hypothetical protein